MSYKYIHTQTYTPNFQKRRPFSIYVAVMFKELIASLLGTEMLTLCGTGYWSRDEHKHYHSNNKR